MSAPLADPGAVLSGRMAGRVAGVFLWVGAVATVINSVVEHSAGRRLALEGAMAVAGAAVGLFGVLAPWERWPTRVTLSLLVPGLLLMGYSTEVRPEPYLASVSMVVVAVWAGLFQPRFTSVRLAPVLAIAFWLPLSGSGYLAQPAVATAVVTAVAVVVGEALATLRAQLERAQRGLLAGKERRTAALLERSADTVIVFDAAGLITYVSPAATATFGYDPKQMEGQSVLEFMVDNIDQQQRESWAALWGEATASTAADEVVQTRVRHADGHWVEVETVGQDYADDPEVNGFVYTIRDVSARRQLERRLERQAFFDELTGLPNRAQFVAHLTARLRMGEPISVLFVDLDGFKVINDSAGHEVGDQLLTVVARRLERFFVAGGHLLARLGGDEFVAALPTSDLEAAEELARSIVDALEEPLQLGPRSLTVTASIGVASSDDNRTAEDLVRAADTAMYVAKADVTNRVTRYRSSMRADLVERLRVEADLRHALDHGDLRVHFQPLIDLATSRPVGAEALVRWQHPERGLLSPGDFIDVAEVTGLVIPLGRWVLERACEVAARWQQSGDQLFRVAVNVSPRQFHDARLVDDIADALDLSRLHPDLLKIEVTESVLVDDIDMAILRLDAIKALGVKLALDDFGTGYSSLSYLRTLPFDILKIDKSFIDTVVERPQDRALVRTINQLGHDLGLVTLAEGIETAEQAATLRGLGVDHGQGYFYARPLPPESITEYFSSPTPAI